MTFIQELITRIEEKNSWGKNELKFLILELITKHFGNQIK